MRRFAPLFLFLLCLLSFTPSRPAVGAPQQPPDFMGMVIRDPFNEWNTNPAFLNAENQTFYDALGQNIANARVKYVRFEFRVEDGSVYDPTNPSAGINFPAYDYFINTVAPRFGFKIIGLLSTNLIKDASDPNAGGGGLLSPELLEPAKADALPGEGEVTTQCYPDPGPNPINPGYRYGCGTTKAMRIWLDHAFAIADRYGPKIATYEVLNEENRYINGNGQGIDPSALGTLMAKFYRVFKYGTAPVSSQIIPPSWRNQQVPGWASQINLILGGLQAGRCDDCAPGGTTDEQYLDAVYKSAPFQGFKSTPTYGGVYPVDGVGYHPYPMEIHLNPESNEPTGIAYIPLMGPRIEGIAGVMAANGDGAHKLWITEIGDRGDPNDAQDAARQAQFLRMAYSALWQEHAVVQTVLWFKYEDFDVVHNDENWGVVRLVPGTTTEYAPSGAVQIYKPSYYAYMDMATNGIPKFSTLYLPYVPHQVVVTTPSPTPSPMPTATTRPTPTMTSVPTATTRPPTTTSAPTPTTTMTATPTSTSTGGAGQR
ncbi:MAG: hypothetical protein H0X37_14935 [Herpetosiphonaceae bacterium]|nr:hypothetical protein [Herpetosiphonaceae bacterium]